MPAIKINVYLSWCTELAFFVNTYHTCGRAYVGRPTIHEVDSTLDGGEYPFIEETHVKEKCDGKAAGKLTTTGTCLAELQEVERYGGDRNRQHNRTVDNVRQYFYSEPRLEGSEWKTIWQN